MIIFLHILHIVLCIVDIPKILRDNHLTTVMEEGTARKEFQVDLSGKKTKYYNILTIIANSLFQSPSRAIWKKNN